MTTLLQKFNKEQEKKMPELKPGDTVKVHQKIKEGGKERIQIFEGIIIAKKHGSGISGMITVRKVVDGVGVERVFPIHSPSLDKIEVIRRAKVRRAKLYYLRTAKGKKARLKKKDFAAAIAPEQPTVAEVLAAPETTEPATETTPETPAPQQNGEETPK
jgi:large subunit ribosomal protein L19